MIDSNKIKNRWIDELEQLYHYMFATMGQSFLELPYGDESEQFNSAINSCMSIKPCRDGYKCLLEYSNLHPKNRIMRALVDMATTYERKYADGTTWFIILAISFLRIAKDVWNNNNELGEIYSFKAFDEYVDDFSLSMSNLISEFSENSTKEDSRRYMETAISCMDKEAVKYICDTMEENPDSVYAVKRVGRPNGHFVHGVCFESSDGAVFLSQQIAPDIQVSGRARFIVGDFPGTYESISLFVEKNNENLATFHALKESERLIVSLVIMCQYIDTSDARLFELLSSHDIMLIAYPNNQSHRCRNLLAKVLKSSVIGYGIQMDEANIPMPISFSIDNAEGGTKAIQINEHIDSYIPERRQIASAIISEHMNMKSKDNKQIAELAFMSNLMKDSAMNIYLDYPTQYEMFLYLEKLNDLVRAVNMGLHKKTIPSIYKLLEKQQSMGAMCILRIKHPILDSIHSRCFSSEELNWSRDLAISATESIRMAVSFAKLIMRTTFMEVCRDETEKCEVQHGLAE